MTFNAGDRVRNLSSGALSRRRFVRIGAAATAGALSGFGALPARARTNAELPDERRLKQLVDEAHARFASANGGKNADYIPYLAGVPSHLFGIAIVTADGKVVEAGDTKSFAAVAKFLLNHAYTPRGRYAATPTYLFSATDQDRRMRSILAGA